MFEYLDVLQPTNQTNQSSFSQPENVIRFTYAS